MFGARGRAALLFPHADQRDENGGRADTCFGGAGEPEALRGHAPAAGAEGARLLLLAEGGGRAGRGRAKPEALGTAVSEKGGRIWAGRKQTCVREACRDPQRRSVTR